MGISDFLDKPNKKAWGTKVEIERHRRIRVSLWALAYERYSTIMVDDWTFDTECKKVDPSISTGHDVMDKFFREEFSAFTGQWIHKHPEIDKLDALYHRLQKKGGQWKPPS